VHKNRGCADQNGKMCDKSECVGKYAVEKEVALAPCCDWAAWSEWGSPSKTCGMTSTQRHRKCECDHELRTECDMLEGERTETKEENLDLCCSWTVWEEWSESEKTCGDTKRTRKRLCKCGSLTRSSTEQCGGGKTDDFQEVKKKPCPKSEYITPKSYGPTDYTTAPTHYDPGYITPKSYGPKEYQAPPPAPRPYKK